MARLAFRLLLATLGATIHASGKEFGIFQRLVVLVLLAAVLGCLGPRERRDDAVRLEPAPALTCKPEPKHRWLDSLGQPYSEAFRKSFSYKHAEVDIRFARQAPAFQGTLTARKLKPNFAYQMKLVGMSPAVWGEEGDSASNRALGEVGRWWRPGKEGGNAYYFDAEEDKDKLEGYIVFGYFVTDADGKAEVAFRLDSSYHVLWKASQWARAASDSTPTTHRVVAEAGRYGYDLGFPPGEFSLYAETQTGRPPIGQVRLPPGAYRCFFLLTEETFHDYANPDGGDWGAALAAIVRFTITPPQAGEAAQPQQAPPVDFPKPNP